MTEFERELLDVLRNLNIPSLDAIQYRIIDLEKIAHERIDILQARLEKLERLSLIRHPSGSRVSSDQTEA